MSLELTAGLIRHRVLCGINPEMPTSRPLRWHTQWSIRIEPLGETERHILFEGHGEEYEVVMKQISQTYQSRESESL